MSTHICAGCKTDVKMGTKYCPNCGAKLSWPKEKKTIIRKSKNKVKLPINPENLDKLVRLDGQPFLKSFILSVFFFCFFGVIFSIVLWYRQRQIQQWFVALRTEDRSIDEFKKYLQSIIKCCRWIIGLNLATILIFILCLIPSSSWNTDIFAFVFYIGFFSIGLATGIHIKQLTEKIRSDTENDKMFTYEFGTEQKIKWVV